MSAPSKIAAAQASERFTKALIDLAAAGLRTPCGDLATGHLWLSEINAERAQAAILCHGCPVQLECWAAAVARDERFGVWGGVDRTRNPNGKAQLGRPPKIAATT
jgi:Transcription factor WhiB